MDDEGDVCSCHLLLTKRYPGHLAIMVDNTSNKDMRGHYSERDRTQIFFHEGVPKLMRAIE